MSMSKADILHSVIIEAIDSAIFDEKKNSELTGWVGELYDIADDVIYKDSQDKLVELLAEHKEFNEAMHEMPAEWTIKESQRIHKKTCELLKELGHEI